MRRRTMPPFDSTHITTPLPDAGREASEYAAILEHALANGKSAEDAAVYATEIMAEIAERNALNAAEEAAWQAKEAARPAPDDHDYWFFELADHAIDAVCNWTYWHMARAEERGVPQGHARGPDPYGRDPKLRTDPTKGALDGVIDAARALGRALEDGDDDDVMDAAQDALAGAITRAKEAAEEERRPPSPCGGGHEWRDMQAEEIETSYLRGWARMFDAIEYCRRHARDNPEEAMRWHLEAAHDLALNAPPTVRQFSP